MKKHLCLLFLYLFPIFSIATESPTPPPAPIETPSLQAEPSAPSYEATLLKMLLTLGGLLALVFLTIWILRKITHGRIGGFGSQKKIAILEKKPLSPKTLLYLIEVEGKKILLSESQVEITTHDLSPHPDLYE